MAARVQQVRLLVVGRGWEGAGWIPVEGPEPWVPGRGVRHGRLDCQRAPARTDHCRQPLPLLLVAAQAQGSCPTPPLPPARPAAAAVPPGPHMWAVLLCLLCLLCADLDIIHAELRAKDIENCNKILEGFKKIRMVRGEGREGAGERGSERGRAGASWPRMLPTLPSCHCNSTPPPPRLPCAARMPRRPRLSSCRRDLLFHPCSRSTPLQTLTKEQKDEQASAEKALAWLEVSPFLPLLLFSLGPGRAGERAACREAHKGSVSWAGRVVAVVPKQGPLCAYLLLPACLPTCLQEGKDIRFGEWTQKDVDWLNTVQVGSCGWAACLWQRAAGQEAPPAALVLPLHHHHRHS